MSVAWEAGNHMAQKDLHAAYDRARALERAAKAKFDLVSKAAPSGSLGQLRALAQARREWDTASTEVNRLAKILASQ